MSNTAHPLHFDTLICRATVIDGSGSPAFVADVGLLNGYIAFIGDTSENQTFDHVINGMSKVLAPGFIDVHTHDDTVVIRKPEMLPKLSQGVTTVIVGNCGISASPVTLKGDPPDPMSLLGTSEYFKYSKFIDYKNAVNAAVPAVNVAALVGHTALRNNQMDNLMRTALPHEIEAMRTQLDESLAAGALGLSSGLAYASAFCAETDEVKQLCEVLNTHGAIYTTHMRSEFAPIREAMSEAFETARHANSPLIISHLKCAGVSNWGRSEEILTALEDAAAHQDIGCDCYPYSAGSSTLDLKQVTDDFEIFITWSTPHPEMAGQSLAKIANQWSVSLMDAAKRLQPAGAVYHNMDHSDVERILAHPLTMIGSDGLPDDPRPHPRLWGAFPRVLGHYSRDRQLFPLTEAIYKMTGLSAARFGLTQRGLIRVGYWADLTLFDPLTIKDTAQFDDPIQKAEGILAVWVNGILSYANGEPCSNRAGRFLARDTDLRPGFNPTF